MTPETKKELTRLKGEYSGAPFDDDENVYLDFLCFVVEHYQEESQKVLNAIRNCIKIALKKETKDGKQ